MDTLFRLDVTRLLGGACCLLLAAAAWIWQPAGLEMGFVRLALGSGCLLASLGIAAAGRRGALVAVGLWCQIVLAMLVVAVLYMLLTGSTSQVF